MFFWKQLDKSSERISRLPDVNRWYLQLFKHSTQQNLTVTQRLWSDQFFFHLKGITYRICCDYDICSDFQFTLFFSFLLCSCAPPNLPCSSFISHDLPPVFFSIHACMNLNSPALSQVSSRLALVSRHLFSIPLVSSVSKVLFFCSAFLLLSLIIFFSVFICSSQSGMKILWSLTSVKQSHRPAAPYTSIM